MSIASLYARALGRFASAAARVAPRPAPRHFARLVAVYEGSAIASTIGGLLDDAWTSPILSQRVKALMFGVIARGLGDAAALSEARAMLAQAGVDTVTSARALDHLGAPGLTDSENLLLGFARDTLWYQPAAIQRRARAVRDRLARPEFIEALGVCSLANAVCRLSAAVVEP